MLPRKKTSAGCVLLERSPASRQLLGAFDNERAEEADSSPTWPSASTSFRFFELPIGRGGGFPVTGRGPVTVTGFRPIQGYRR